MNSEGNYLWVSGESVSFTNWHPGEPNNAFGSESFVHMIRTDNGFGATAGKWNDLKSPNLEFWQFDPLASVIEIIPPTLSISKLGLNFELQWQNKPGWILQRSLDLNADTWLPWSGPITNTGIDSKATISPDQPRQFFRLSLSL